MINYRTAVAAVAMLTIVVAVSSSDSVRSSAEDVSVSKSICDHYSAGNTPCVAAHSVTRSLFAAYDGALYKVLRKADNATMDIHVKVAGGVADAPAQEAFCADSECIITVLYDQTENKNHLGIEKGQTYLSAPRNGQDIGVPLTKDTKVLLGGQPVYSAVFDQKCNVKKGDCVNSMYGYSNRTARKTAVGDEPQTIYALFSGKHYSTGCCFDYGNAERNHGGLNPGNMEAVYFGCNDTAPPLPSCDKGPYVLADMECMHKMMEKALPPTHMKEPPAFLAAFVKGEAGHLAIMSADAQKANSLNIIYDGKRPAGYEVMDKQGAIVLGVGGDNSPWGSGTFYEGVMTAGFSSNETDAAVLANIVAAGYSDVELH